MADRLVPMKKDGQTITVHPLAVEDHKGLGWKVVGEEPAAAAPEIKNEKPAEGTSRRSRSRKNKSAEGDA